MLRLIDGGDAKYAKYAKFAWKNHISVTTVEPQYGSTCSSKIERASSSSRSSSSTYTTGGGSLVGPCEMMKPACTGTVILRTLQQLT